MNKNNLIFLFFGEGSEYVLTNLYKYMLESGYNCIELDLMKDNFRDILEKIKGEKVVFITSAHLFKDKYNVFNANDKECIIGPLNILDIIKPIRKIFYPHDLITPFIGNELRYLSLFDVFLSPLPYLSHLEKYAKVIEVGWIKKFQPRIKLKGSEKKVVHILSNFERFNKMEFEKAFSIWQPIFSKDVSVKLPYSDGSDHFESLLIEKGINVISARTNVFEVIEQYDLILTNGSSSVSLESSYSGKPTINMLDGENNISLQQNLLHGYPNLKIMSIQECSNYLDKLINGSIVLEQSEDMLNPFDFKKAEDALTNF